MYKKFDELFIDETKYGTKIKTDKYLSEGKYPIVDQGQKKISGYTDIEEGIFKEVPAIIFGDHTRLIKYIDIPFFIGADGVKIIRSRLKKVNYKYLYYALLNVHIPNTGYNRHFKWLKETKIFYPDSEKQKHIVEVLDKISLIIEKKNKQIEQCDFLLKSLFIEMFGDPVENPKKWDISTLLTLGSCKNGMNFHIDDFGVEINCIGVGDFKDYDVISNTYSLPIVSLNSMPTEDYLLKDEDIVFVRSNGNKTMVGRSIVIYPGENLVTFSGFCIRYRNEDSSIMVPYLLRVLKTESIRMQMYGRGANIQNLNQKILASLKIPIPPMNLQEKFVQSVSSIDKSKLAVKKSLEELEILKKSLMQKYFA